MKKVLLAMAVISLSACGKVDRLDAAITGYAKVCIDHVTYLQFTSGAAVQVDQTGKPMVCNK